MNYELKKLQKKPIKSATLCLFIVLSFLFTKSAMAASLYLKMPQSAVAIHDAIPVTIMLDAQGQSINTLEIHFIYPSDIFEVESISDAGSIISEWVEHPKAENGQVVFSGIIPGGFDGLINPLTHEVGPGKIVEILLRARTTGTANFLFSDLHAYLNDGAGTETTITATEAHLYVDESSHFNYVAPSEIEPPLPFEIKLARDPLLFDNAWFITFSSTDIDSGIDHYEVKEGSGNWHERQSPYRISSFTRGTIFVKAIDRAGNVRIAEISAPAPSSTGFAIEEILLPAILLLGIILLCLYVLIIRKKRR